MSLIRKDAHTYPKERCGSMDQRRALFLISVSVMFILLMTSFGALLLVNDGPVKNMENGNGTENGDLVIELDHLPEKLRSGMMEEVTGTVKDKDEHPVDDVSIAMEFSAPDHEPYVTRSGSNGSFTLTFWSPISEEEEMQSVNFTASKKGYLSDIMHYELPVMVPGTWTFMIYMSDCDLEAWALSDINEMETIPDSPFLNIVVQLDRWKSRSSKDDKTNGDWTTAKRFEIENDDDPVSISSREIEDLGEIDSSDPEELLDFIRFTMDNYNSDNYALVLWNHGSGIDGICWEQSTEEDQVMSIDELASALDSATGGGSDPLDIIGFDACLMSTIEVAYEIAPYGKRLLSSEITEPTFGWDYTSLAGLVWDPFLDVDELASHIIDDYIMQSETKSARRSMSLTLTDLTLIEEVVHDLDSLSNTVNSAGPAEIYNLRIARKYSQPISDGISSEAVDLRDLVENMKELTTNSMVMKDCDTLMGSIDRTILRMEKKQGFSDIETDGLNGLSIFSPEFRDIYDSKEDYDDLKFSQETSWIETLEAVYDNMGSDMEERVGSFDLNIGSCYVKDEDGDGLPDTMIFKFNILSTSNSTQEFFLGCNVYDLRGTYVNSTWMNLTIQAGSRKGITITYYPDGEDAVSGMYRISAYLCLGSNFDPLELQDYTRSGYRWLEVYGSD
ncbi:MAG: clostripain-related cysteine peptidase [Thermoplasmatota archaeon]